MKILITRSSPSRTIGGAELSAHDIAIALAELGHKPLVITNLSDARVLQGIKKSQIHTVPSSVYSWLRFVKPIDLIVLYLWYKKLIERLKPDMLFPQSRYDQMVLTLIAYRRNIPIVWRDPGDLVPQLRFPLTNPLQKGLRAFQKWSIAHARHIMTLNHSDRTEILEAVPKLNPERISVIGSNIRFNDYSPAATKKQGSVLTIGTLSRLDEHKGIQYLINAFNRISKDSTEEVRLVIAGDGPFRAVLEKQAMSNPSITFIGNQANVSEVLNSFDILVQPAEFEGWGRNVREGMLFGLPVLGSDVGGIKEQITDGQNGLLFKVGSITDLERKLRRLIDDKKLRSELGNNARKHVLELGDWTQTVRDQIVPTLEHNLLSVRVDGSAFLSEPNISGVGHYSQSLAKILTERATTTITTGPLDSNKASGFKEFLDRVYRKLASYGLAPAHDLFKPLVDLTVFPNFSTWPSAHTRLTAAVIHDLTYLRYPELVERKNLSHLRKVIPKAIERSDFIITVSEAVKKEIVDKFRIKAANVIVTHIPPGDRFNSHVELDVHKLYGIPTKSYILFIGNREPRKNLERLVDAYLSLDQEVRKHTSLVIAGGSGWRNKPLEKRLAKLITHENILATGYVPEEHVPALYQQATVFALPSIYEGFGMGVLEALASRTTVVAADIPAVREAGGSLARYFNPLDTEALTKALDASLKDPGIDEIAVQKHLATFSWEKNAQTIIDYCRNRLR